jgi:Ca2+-binding EF-hand superfamily protein
MPPKTGKLTYDQEAEEQFQKKQEEAYSKLSDKQKKVLQLFKDFDDDRNERLSKVEFRKIMMSCGMPKDKVDALFAAADTNFDDQISTRELMIWILGNQYGGGNAPKEIKAYMDRPSDPEEAKGLFISFMKDLCAEAKGGIVTSPSEYEGRVFFKESEKTQFEARKGVKVETRDVDSGDSTNALNSLFQNIDVNGNSYISMSELVSGLQSYGFNCHKKVIEKMFVLLDGCEMKDKELTIGPTTRQTTDADASAIATGKIKYTTLTTKIKDGALDKIEFMNILGQELTSEEMEKLPEEVRQSAEQRAALQNR